MRRPVLLALTVLVGAGLGCGGVYRAPVMPGQGLIYTSYSAPLETNFDATPLGTKHAEGDVTYLREPFFGLNFAWGEADVDEIARKGQIDTIHYTEYEVISVLGMFVQFTVHVRGD